MFAIAATSAVALAVGASGEATQPALDQLVFTTSVAGLSQIAVIEPDGTGLMNAEGTAQRCLAPASGDLSLLPVGSWRPRGSKR